LSDLKVNVLIVHETFSSEPILHVAAVQIHLLAQLIKPGIGKIFNGLLHGKCFKRFPQIVELFGLLHSNFFAGKTPIWQKRDISFLH
jgi:hypothetical protein